MSYRRWASQPDACPALAPTIVPPRRPPPAPIAAPTPGLPEAAPIAAPSPAPRRVPRVAVLTVLWAATPLGGIPICCCAHCRHPASSTWNCSNGFPGAGSTITPGPEGRVAHPLSATATTATATRVTAHV